jgi:hypothetical protein
MMEGFLSLSTAEELFEKLRHDIEQFREDSGNAYKAYNFFVTAEHLPDWVGDRKIKDKNPHLRISSHLATGAKHFTVTNPKKRSIDDTSIDVYVEDGFMEEGYIEVIQHIQLQGEEAELLGTDAISVQELAEEVFSYWSTHFQS